ASYTCEVLKVEVRVSFGEKAYLLTALVDTGEGSDDDDDSSSDSSSGTPSSSSTSTPGASTSTTTGGGSSTTSDSDSTYPFTLVKLVESMEID
ncbi:MAG: hypothetical protein ACQKBW_09740, partial [Puniceicoccales bacterium]